MSDRQADWLMCKCQCLWDEFSSFRPEGRSGRRVHVKLRFLLWGSHEEISNSSVFNNLLNTLPGGVKTCDCIFENQVMSRCRCTFWLCSEVVGAASENCWLYLILLLLLDSPAKSVYITEYILLIYFIVKSLSIAFLFTL